MSIVRFYWGSSFLRCLQCRAHARGSGHHRAYQKIQKHHVLTVRLRGPVYRPVRPQGWKHSKSGAGPKRPAPLFIFRPVPRLPAGYGFPVCSCARMVTPEGIVRCSPGWIRRPESRRCDRRAQNCLQFPLPGQCCAQASCAWRAPAHRGPG